MKRVTSIILVIVMCIGVISVAPMPAKAAEESMTNYRELTLGTGAEVTISQADEEVWFSFTPEETKTYRFYSESVSEYSDSYATLYDCDEVGLKQDDDSGDDMQFEISYQLDAGETYYLCVSAYDAGSVLKVYVGTLLSVTKLEIVENESNRILERCSGFETTDNYGNEMFYYDIYHSTILDGVTFQVTYEDGTTKIVRYSKLDGDMCSMEDQYEYPWTVDSENYITFYCDEASVNIPIMILARADLDKVSIGEACLIDEPHKQEWLSFTPVQTGRYTFYIEEEAGSVSSFIEVFDSDMQSLDDEQTFLGDNVINSSASYDLEAGETYYLSLTNFIWEDNSTFKLCVDKTVKVTKLELVSNLPIELMENVDGHWIEDEDGNEYFEYFYASSYIEVRAIYEDGTVKKLYFEQDEIADTQAQAPWGVGVHYVTLTYNGVSLEVPVTVLENTVKSISVVSVPEVKYALGDGNYMYLNSSGKYEFSPTEINGMGVAVFYKNGICQTYIVDESKTIEGYPLHIENIFLSEAGVYNATITYLGQKDTYQVEVIDSPVSSIEVLRGPDNTTPMFQTDYVGMQFKIVYTDGNEKIVTVTEENLSYETRYNPIYRLGVVKVDDLELTIWPYDETDEDGNTTRACTISYAGQKCTYRGIQPREKKISAISVSNVSLKAEGMIVDMQMSDGTSKSYVMKPLMFNQYDWNASGGCFRTEWGILTFNIYAEDDNNDGIWDRYTVAFYDSGVSKIVVNANEDAGEDNVSDDAINDKNESSDEGSSDNSKDSETEKEDSKKVTVKETAIKKVKAGKKKLTVKWKKKTDVTGYEVQVALKKNFKKVKKTVIVKGAKKASVVVKKLKAKKTYYVRVRAYKEVNGEKHYSKWSDVVRRKTK